MISISNRTGQLQETEIANCPVFMPAKLSKNLVSQLSINVKIVKFDVQNNNKLLDVLNLYFQKFFAGNMSLIEGFSDLPVENLYLWSDAKISKDVHVKQVINDVHKFKKVLDLIKLENSINRTNVVKYNKLLQPKGSNFGLRKGDMRVGNPSGVDYAFFAPPVDQVYELLDDLFDFINSENESNVNVALITMFQLFFIHPFKDGNGRVVRTIFISLLGKEMDFIPTYLLALYFKVINPENYYLSLKSYRTGNIHEIKKFHEKAIEWTNHSTNILAGFIEEYTNKVGQHNIDSDKNYSQVVIKAETTQKVDENIFQFHSKKAGKNIYINSGLLNVMNQFEYYLRYELRMNQSN